MNKTFPDTKKMKKKKVPLQKQEQNPNPKGINTVHEVTRHHLFLPFISRVQKTSVIT